MSSKSKLDFVLHLGDNGLILAQRLGEWCGHGPVLEQDIALTNIALDVLGQARYFYQYAAEIDGKGKSEDDYAYFRNEREFKNFLLLEQPNMDWAYTLTRQFYYDTYCELLFSHLMNGKDVQLAAIASKAIKEIQYHVKFSSEWMIRMGDGTEESHNRVLNAVNALWEFTGEFFEPASYESFLIEEGTLVNLTHLKEEWMNKVGEVLSEATLEVPKADWFQSGGKQGIHSEYLGLILTDLQYLQRTYPGLNW